MGFLFMKNNFKIISVIIGTLIGAGFASGQEIYIFFYAYGVKGILGILISSALMGIIIYKTLILVKEKQISTYKEFLNIFTKKDYIKSFISIIINMFILITFFIMIAGFGAYFEQRIGFNRLIGSTIIAVLCITIFKTSQKGVVKVSEILAPIVILFIILIFALNIKEFNINNINHYLINNNRYNYILSSILYCSYNSILLIPVLITLNNLIYSKKQLITVSMITTIIVIILSLCIFFILVRVDVNISKLEMPAEYVVSKMSKVLEITYGFIILSSIFTTAVSLGNTFLKNISSNKKSYTHFATIMCITSIIISNIGFSNLINKLYPIFGYLGSIQIFIVLFREKIKLLKNNKKFFIE